MRLLPWVSARAYDLVVDERDRLRRINDSLSANLIGVLRRKNGLRETQKQPHEPPEPVPDSVREIIEGFENQTSRNAMWRSVGVMRKQGRSWDEIERALKASVEE